MTKYYAVKVGRVPGLYSSWDECKEQTEKFPKAKFKSFKTIEDALVYLDGIDFNNSDSKALTEDASVQLYVDGSWNKNKKQYGWGFVLVEDGKSVSSGFGKGANEKSIRHFQIGGEVISVLQGLDRAIFKGYKEVQVVYDYLGIEMWAIGEWEAKSAIAKAYLYYIEKYKEKINITFKKVKSHSGNKFNNEADRLAKKGANK